MGCFVLENFNEIIGFILGDFSFFALFALFCVAALAGFVDAIAGGGGAITIPALMLAGLSPASSLATNKLQASFGSFSATFAFWRKGHLQLKNALPLIFCAFLFAAFGSVLVQFFSVDFLRKFLPLLLFCFGVYFLFSARILGALQIFFKRKKDFSDEIESAPKKTQNKTNFYKAIILFLTALIAFYDGFFGPGTGSFFYAALLGLGGYIFAKKNSQDSIESNKSIESDKSIESIESKKAFENSALAHAKLLNFATNIASLLLFALGGQIVIFVGLIMGVGQFLGANLGAKVAMHFGSALVRPLIVIVSFFMSAKLFFGF